MVPHVKIEELLQEIVGGEEEEAPQVAVTAVPDPKKGERLVVVHTEVAQSPDEMCRALKDRGLPNLYIPSADSFHRVDDLPVLGTGKLDLKAVKELALQEFGNST